MGHGRAGDQEDGNLRELLTEKVRKLQQTPVMPQAKTVMRVHEKPDRSMRSYHVFFHGPYVSRNIGVILRRRKVLIPLDLAKFVPT